MVNEQASEYWSDWFSNNIPVWEQVFQQSGLIGKDNLTFLEIGCFEGRASNHMLDNILTGNNCSLHVVDIFGGSLNETGMNWDTSYDYNNLYQTFIKNTKKHSDKIHIHIGTSGKILKTAFDDLMFDFIYVDGSHTSYDVLQDAVLVHPLLKHGGIIIFDDFLWKDPNNLHPTNSPELAITTFYKNYEIFYDVIFQGYQVGLIKK